MTVIPDTTNPQHSLSRNSLEQAAAHNNIDSTNTVHTSGFPGALRQKNHCHIAEKMISSASAELQSKLYTNPRYISKRKSNI